MALFVLAGAPGVMMETGGISFLQRVAGRGRARHGVPALGVAENAGQALGITAAGILTAPLGLMAILNAQGMLYL